LGSTKVTTKMKSPASRSRVSGHKLSKHVRDYRTKKKRRGLRRQLRKAPRGGAEDEKSRLGQTQDDRPLIRENGELGKGRGQTGGKMNNWEKKGGGIYYPLGVSILVRQVKGGNRNKN